MRKSLNISLEKRLIRLLRSFQYNTAIRSYSLLVTGSENPSTVFYKAKNDDAFIQRCFDFSSSYRVCQPTKEFAYDARYRNYLSLDDYDQAFITFFTVLIEKTVILPALIGRGFIGRLRLL